MFLFMGSNVDMESTVLKFYIFVSAMVDEIMISTVIIDFVLTLTMLKVYRRALFGFFKKSFMNNYTTTVVIY